jgi:hypothetical protein
VPAFLLTASLLVAYVGSGVKFLGRPFREERAETDAIIAVEWSLLIVVLLALGPQTNSPHLSMLLLPAMAAAAWVMEPGRPGKRAVLIASVILWLGLIFPPTMRGTEHLKGLWRGVSGAAWCMLPLIPALLYSVLRHRETPEPVDQ